MKKETKKKGLVKHLGITGSLKSVVHFCDLQ